MKRNNHRQFEETESILLEVITDADYSESYTFRNDDEGRGNISQWLINLSKKWKLYGLSPDIDGIKRYSNDIYWMQVSFYRVINGIKYSVNSYDSISDALDDTSLLNR